MNVIRKDATIQNTDGEFPGTFRVVLSTGTKDRDDEEVKRDEWREPLPDHITFDVDHGMSVEKTIGSGRPYFDAAGRLLVDGTYSSLQKAQDVRTLVNEGHIKTVSVAFARHTSTNKDGTKSVQRELLNGAFVAIPANPEAVVLASKAGARNSSKDQAAIQKAHDATVEAGAVCAGPEDDSGAEEGAVGGKSMDDSTTVETKAKYDAEQLRQMLADGHAIENANGDPSYPIGDEADLENAIRAVGRGAAGHDKIRAYIIRRAKELGAEDKIPENWNTDGSLKATTGAFTKGHIKALNLMPPEAASDVTRLAQAADAALDEAMNFLDGIDKTDMPETVAQAIDLSTAGWVAVRALMDALHAYDPDGGDHSAADADQQTTTTEGSAATDAKSADVAVLDLQFRIAEALASAEAV